MSSNTLTEFPLDIPVPEPIGTQELLDSFLSGKSPNTIEAYRQDLQAFTDYLQVDGIYTASGFLLKFGAGHANHTALRYKAHLISEQKSPNTINRRLAALRSLIKLAKTLGLVAWSLEVENLKVEAYRDTRGPGEAGLKSILRAAGFGRNPDKAVRDVAILRVLHDLGLRRAELCRLDLDDLDLERKTLLVLGKGRTQEIHLTLPEPTLEALRQWLDVRGLQPGPLFTNFHQASEHNSRLTGAGLYHIVRKLGKKVGITTRPHGIRHTAITTAIKNAQAAGIDLEEVLDFSRHKDVKVLLIYRDRERNVQGKIASIVANNL